MKEPGQIALEAWIPGSIWKYMDPSLQATFARVEAAVRAAALEEAATLIEEYDPADPAVEGRGVLAAAIRAAL